MKRILIVGISGTGKTQLAQRLAQQTHIPATHCDAIAWRPGWQPEDSSVVSHQIHNIIAGKEWIIEGYIQPLAAERIRKSDVVVYLDLPGYLAFLGGIKRWWNFRGKERPEMQKGNKEDLVFRILWSMLNRYERPELEKELQNFEQKVIRLRTWDQVNNFTLPVKM